MNDFASDSIQECVPELIDGGLVGCGVCAPCRAQGDAEDLDFVE